MHASDYRHSIHGARLLGLHYAQDSLEWGSVRGGAGGGSKGVRRWGQGAGESQTSQNQVAK